MDVIQFSYNPEFDSNEQDEMDPQGPKQREPRTTGTHGISNRFDKKWSPNEISANQWLIEAKFRGKLQGVPSKRSTACPGRYCYIISTRT
jgi:hypothetical protein